MKQTPLKRKTPLKQKKSKPRRKPISPASPAQRKKARENPCIVTSATKEFAQVDPAHLWPRGRGGCSDPLCVVPLERSIHERFDNGQFDLLPYLTGTEFLPELCHALEHADGSLTRLIHRLTGQRHVPILDLDLKGQ